MHTHTVHACVAHMSEMAGENVITQSNRITIHAFTRSDSAELQIQMNERTNKQKKKKKKEIQNAKETKVAYDFGFICI